jgi:hypothetical protein
MEILAVCETLGAGMGAKQKVVAGENGKGKEKVDTEGTYQPIGNAPLRLWVGERFLGQCIMPLCRSVLTRERLQRYSSVRINLTAWRSRRRITRRIEVWWKG